VGEVKSQRKQENSNLEGLAKLADECKKQGAREALILRSGTRAVLEERQA
jgi:hypothetical protein